MRLYHQMLCWPSRTCCLSVRPVRVHKSHDCAIVVFVALPQLLMCLTVIEGPLPRSNPFGRWTRNQLRPCHSFTESDRETLWCGTVMSCVSFSTRIYKCSELPTTLMLGFCVRSSLSTLCFGACSMVMVDQGYLGLCRRRKFIGRRPCVLSWLGMVCASVRKSCCVARRGVEARLPSDTCDTPPIPSTALPHRGT